jgi:exopolysaccharide biosynthesis polyprenyl glycosylphosphotransferase
MIGDSGAVTCNGGRSDAAFPAYNWPGPDSELTLGGERSSRFVAEGLQLASILMPFGILCTATSSGIPGTPGGIVAAVIVFWVVRRRFAGIRLSPLLVGPGSTAACAAFATVGVLSLLAFWVPPIDVHAGEIALLAATVFAGGVILQPVADRVRPRSRLLLVAPAESARELRAEFERQPRLRQLYDWVETFDTTHRPASRELADVVDRVEPDLLILDDGPTRPRALSELLERAPGDFRVVGFQQFFEHAFGRIPVEHLSAAWFMSVLHLYQRPYSRLSKRVIDVTVASTALVLLAPVLAVVALLVHLSGPGRIIFRQTRVGEGGRLFEVLKFRTMVDAAEQGAAVWASENDERRTRVGRFMRSARADELPQLWNVLRGEMSLVGPRPERPEFLDLLQREVPFWTSRQQVKPGITGWAQIRRGYTADAPGAAEKLSYDLYYLRNRCLFVDLVILARTARIVLSGIAAHVGLQQQPRIRVAEAEGVASPLPATTQTR